MSAPPAIADPVLRVRRPLARTAAALARGHLTVGFLGGSITDAKTGTRWPEPFVAWLTATYPDVRFTVENAAVGATGSDLAVFRCQRDILTHGCDLVFVEYAVNDFDQPTARRNRTREGLLRQLLAADGDVVLVHAFRPEMLDDLLAGQSPASIAEFERLAEHYGVGSVNAGLHSLRQVQSGLLTWSEWLPDGLHPEQRGSLSYAESVIAFFKTALAAVPPSRARTPLPPPLTPGAWERIAFIPLATVTRHGPWTLRRWTAHAWIDQVLHCTAPEATLRFPFTGRGLVIAFDFGHASGEIRYRIDGGAWIVTARERPAWLGTTGWFRPTVIADDLVSGPHLCELVTTPAIHAGRIATTTTLAFFGVLL
jgi:hypothetical protein